MYRIETPADLTTALTLRLPEGPSLEYKSTLDLSTPTKRVETLKDLTGMANGGGGTVIFGIAEDPASGDLPGDIHPLADPGLLMRLQGIVRDAVRPPLLAEFRVVPWPGGYVLVAEVTPSPVGPYMVEAYGQHRYFRRANRSTNPMSEREVRDAYALAGRWRENRHEVWRQNSLPIVAPKGQPWLTVSAVPEGPLHDLVNPATTHPHRLRLPDDQGWILERAGIGVLYQNLRVWADGYYAEESVEGLSVAKAIRISRSGAVGLGTVLHGDNLGPWLPGMLNAQFLLLSWVWRCVGLRAPSEVQVQLHSPERLRLIRSNRIGGYETLELRRPWPASEPIRLLTVITVLPWELSSASHRHHLVREMWDRVNQAFGEPRAPFEGFEIGWLYDMAGRQTGHYLGPGGVQRGHEHLFWVCEDGAVERAQDHAVVGWADGGTVYDLDGCAVAATGFATSPGLPRTYRVAQPVDQPAPRLTSLGRHPGQGRSAPALRGNPSTRLLQDLVTLPTQEAS